MGLLDQILSPFGDDRAANLAMAAGLLAPGSFGTKMSRGLLGAQQAQDASVDRQFKQKMMQAQIDNYNSEVAQRAAALAQQARRDKWLSDLVGPNQDVQRMSMESGPEFSGPTSPQAIQTASQVATGTHPLADPIRALVAENMGIKGAFDAAKMLRPDMQVSNGFAYDKNNLRSGFLPQFNVSQDGKASVTAIGADGIPRVSAAPGAVDAFTAFEMAKRGTTPMKVYNPQTQREEYTTEGTVVNSAGGRRAPASAAQPYPQQGGPTQVPSNTQQARDAEGIAIVRSELAKPGNSPQDVEALQRELRQRTADFSKRYGAMPPPGQSGNMAAGPSAAEEIARKAAETQAVDTAKADVVRDTQQRSEVKNAGKLTSMMDEAISLLKQGPTSSIAGTAVDKGLGLFGATTKGAELAARLDAISGWAVSNVPRMEGPQSNIDVENYKTMAGRVGDRTLPVQVRMAAAEQVKALQDKYAHLNGGAAPATGGFRIIGVR